MAAIKLESNPPESRTPHLTPPVGIRIVTASINLDLITLHKGFIPKTSRHIVMDRILPFRTLDSTRTKAYIPTIFFRVHSSPRFTKQASNTSLSPFVLNS
ncbi:hypothetical protein ACHAW6_012429 [Cyclotella cf. meneghiniana]